LTKCGHVIQRDDGNYAIQPNNRITVFDPSFTTKIGHKLIDRQINTHKFGVENTSKWHTEDSNSYHYKVEERP